MITIHVGKDFGTSHCGDAIARGESNLCRYLCKCPRGDNLELEKKLALMRPGRISLAFSTADPSLVRDRRQTNTFSDLMSVHVKVLQRQNLTLL